MLLSPGHSPRRLSSPSPSVSETPVRQTQTPGPSNSITLTTPQNPNPRKRNPSTVLDEDTYVAAIEKIIQRDFFPDIPKLRDRLDWLEATRSGDPVLIRDAQLKIIERRSGKASVHADGNNIPTPGSTFFRNTTPFEVDQTPGTDRFVKDDIINAIKESGDVEGIDTSSLSLDEFFRRYTSEDNDSFVKLIEKVNRNKKLRYDFLLEGEKRDDKGLLIEGEKRDRITDGYGTSDQPLATLDGWKYTAKNLLMYHPADRGEVALTTEERANRLKAMTKEVCKTNTRFHGKMMDYGTKEDDEVVVVYNTVAGGTPVPWLDRNGDKMKKYDLEDLRKSPILFYVESSKKADNGYSFVKTPSPAPGADESPFITWGEIEGTPLRLEPEDTPVDIGGSGNGPQFNIPLPPSRDVKAHSLSREASRKIRDRSRMFQKPPLASGGASPGGRTLSPAAQKFVRNAIAKSSHSAGVDESLRASYRGSSPGFSTPKGGRSASRLGRDTSLSSRSPSVREGSNPPW